MLVFVFLHQVIVGGCGSGVGFFDGGLDAPFLAVYAGEEVQLTSDGVDGVGELLVLFCDCGCDGEDGDVVFCGEVRVTGGPADVGFDLAPDEVLGGLVGGDAVADSDAEG